MFHCGMRKRSSCSCCVSTIGCVEPRSSRKRVLPRGGIRVEEPPCSPRQARNLSSEIPSTHNTFVNPSPAFQVAALIVCEVYTKIPAYACFQPLGKKKGNRKASPASSIRCASPSAGERNLLWLCKRCTALFLSESQSCLQSSFRRLKFKAQSPFSLSSEDQAKKKKKRIFDDGLISFYHLLHQIICKLPLLSLIILVY